MKTLRKLICSEDRGVLTFEWILLITVLVIGIVGGVSAVRDALIDELGDVVGAAVNIDQSYVVRPEGCVEDCQDALGNTFRFDDTVPTCPPGDGDAPGRERSTLDNAQTVEHCQP